MPRLFQRPDLYQARGVLRKYFHGPIWRYVIDHEGNADEKHSVVAGVYSPDDIPLLNMILYFERPHDRTKTRPKFSTSDSLPRSGRLGSANTVERLERLAQATEFLSEFHAELVFNWDDLRAEPEQLRFRTALVAFETLRLAAATTDLRITAHEQLAKVPVRTSTGSVNPMASAAALLKVPDLLAAQFDFDRVTFHSLDRRHSLGENIMAFEVRVMTSLFNILSQAPHRVLESEVLSHLQCFGARNFAWAAMCLRPMVTDHSIRTPAGVLMARSIVATELALAEFSEALSAIRDHPEWIDYAVADLLGHTISGEKLPMCYKALLSVIEVYVAELVTNPCSRSNFAHNRLIDKIKATLRNRFGFGDSDSPWRAYETTDRYDRTFYYTTALPVLIS